MSLGFYYDGTRCIGCKVCQIACKDRFNLQVAGPRTRRVDTYECGTYPDTGLYHLSISCNHCDAPACIASCPTDAISKSDDGTVQIDQDLCNLCEACLDACPYGAPQYSEELNTVVKCDSCKPLREAGKNTTCADACPMRAIDFGEIEEMKSKYGSDLVSEIPVMATVTPTGPNLVMKVKDITNIADARTVRL